MYYVFQSNNRLCNLSQCGPMLEEMDGIPALISLPIYKLPGLTSPGERDRCVHFTMDPHTSIISISPLRYFKPILRIHV